MLPRYLAASRRNVAINFPRRRNFPRDEGDNAREILVFAAATKIVARWRERSAAAECIKLAIKSGGDNRNKAATRWISHRARSIPRAVPDPRAGVARSMRRQERGGSQGKGELPR